MTEDSSEIIILEYLIINTSPPLRLAELRKNELYLRGREGAAAQRTEMREGRIDGDPLAELVPGCLWAEPWEVKLGELRAPESL